MGRPAPTLASIHTRRPKPAADATPVPPARILRNLYISQVGKFQFRLIHRCGRVRVRLCVLRVVCEFLGVSER